MTNIRYLINQRALYLDCDSGTYRACTVLSRDNPETACIRLKASVGPPEPADADPNERALFECANGRCAKKSTYRCGACNGRYYCSRQCIAEHWENEHSRHCAPFRASQSDESLTRPRVPFAQICAWRSSKADSPYPLWLTGLPKAGSQVMVRVGHRTKFEAATLLHSDDVSATVRYEVKQHTVKIADVFKHIPQFVERNPFRKHEWSSDSLCDIPEDAPLGAPAPDGADSKTQTSEIAADRAALVALRAARGKIRPFPDHLCHVDADEDDERVCVPDGYDADALSIEDFDDILYTHSNRLAFSTFRDHPAFNSHNVEYQNALVAAMSLVIDGDDHADIDVAAIREQIHKTKPVTVNGRLTIDSADLDIPVRKVTLNVVEPKQIAREIEAVVDSGSSIEAINRATAHKHRALIKRTRTGQRIRTGNGIVKTYEYLPLIVRCDKFDVLCKFWVVDTLPYDFLIGRSLTAAISALPRLDWEVFRWTAPPIDDGLAELDALDELNDRDSSTSYVPESEIDLSEIKCERPEMLDAIAAKLRRYKEAIAVSESDTGLLKHTEYTIEWKDGLGYNPDDKGIVMAPYTRKRSNHREYLRQFGGLWYADIIEESDGPHKISYFGRPKKTGDIRICFDFRLLNRLTKRMLYEMPRIDTLCEKFRGKNFITTLDMKSGYWHIPIKKEHRHRTSFSFGGKLFQWKRLPFGLMNACMFFQRTMDRVFEDFVREGFLVVYIDDLSIISESEAQHLLHVERVLARIAEVGIKLRIDKCTFAATAVDYLGFRINSEGLIATEKYKDKVLNVPTPRRKEDIRAFVGMVQFLHKFVPNLADELSPLTALTKKSVKWRWTELEQNAFRDIRAKIRNIGALHHPDFTQLFHVITDASQQGLGGALCQRVDGELKPVYFCSRRSLKRRKIGTSQSKSSSRAFIVSKNGDLC